MKKIMLKIGDEFFAVPPEKIKEFKVSKAEFDAQMKASDAPEVSGQCNEVYIGNTCCMDKKSLWASCL